MGVTPITTVLVPAASALLLDLPTAKSELGIKSGDTSNDSWLTLVIGQASRSIESYCNRVFAIEQVQDLLYLQQDAYPYQVPGGVPLLQLSRRPVVNFAVLPLGAAASPGDMTLNLGAGFTAASAILPCIVSAQGLALGTTATSGAGTVALSQPVAAAMSPGAPIAFGIQVSQQMSGALGGVPNQNGLAANVHYAIDDRRGDLIRLDAFTGAPVTWEALPTAVIYSAGYAKIPEDVTVAALRWVAWRWAERGRDPTLRGWDQPMVGNQQFWVGGPPSSGGLPREIVELLRHYRTPVVA